MADATPTNFREVRLPIADDAVYLPCVEGEPTYEFVYEGDESVDGTEFINFGPAGARRRDLTGSIRAFKERLVLLICFFFFLNFKIIRLLMLVK